MSDKNLDDFFDEIENDQFIEKTDTNKNTNDNTNHHNFKDDNHSSMNNFGKEVKEAINKSLNSEGFKNLTDIFNEGVSTVKKTFLEDDNDQLFDYQVAEIDTRLTYIKNALNKMSFDIFHRGKYKEGYLDAVVFYVERMEVSKYRILEIEEEVRQAIKKHEWRRVQGNDRYKEGYQEGLKFLRKTMDNSRSYMMTKIKDDLR